MDRRDYHWKVIELFAGIGAPHHALSIMNMFNGNPGVEVIDAVESDSKTINSYNIIHETDFKAQDVLTWDKDVDCDLLWASTPCQAFSVAGKGLGAEDKRGAPLWEATIRILNKTKPKYFILENVKGFLQEKHRELREWFEREVAKAGYMYRRVVLNAKDFGVPQNRERVFYICWKTNVLMDEAIYDDGIFQPSRSKDTLHFSLHREQWYYNDPEKTIFYPNGDIAFPNELPGYKGKMILVNYDALKNQKPGKINKVATLKNCYYGDDVLAAKEIPFHSDSYFTGTQGIAGTIVTATPGFKGKIMEETHDIERVKYRTLSPSECMSLMGFRYTAEFDLRMQGVSPNQIYKNAGNSVVVTVVMGIFDFLVNNDTQNKIKFGI